MTVVVPAKKASFMIICRMNYFHDLRPADPLSQKAAGYAEAVAVAKAYFAGGREEAFGAYLGEAKYTTDLWAAHLMLEHGAPDAEGIKKCLDVIRRYASSPFDKTLAQQEQQWLRTYAGAKQAP